MFKINLAEASATLALATAKNDEEKAEALDTKEKTIDEIRSSIWLESTPAKILSLIAFGILALILLWQGLQKVPPDILNTSQSPPSNSEVIEAHGPAISSQLDVKE